MTTDPTRLAREKKIFDDINYHIPIYNNASLHGQMTTNPVNSTAYFWNYDWNQTARPGSDVSHGNNTISYIVEAQSRGMGGWTTTDIQKFVVLFDKVIWKTPTTYADNVDGSGTGNGWFPEGFAKLGRHSVPLQQRIEGIAVGRGAQLYGNGALNAKILGATQ